LRFNVRTAVVAAASALAVAVPAAARTNPNHPNGTGHANASNQSAGSHRCVAHKVSYIVSGKIDSSQSTEAVITVTNGTASSGTLLLDVTHTNRWARNDRTATPPVSYQLGLNTAVKFDGGATGFSAGERVRLIGKASVIANKHCSDAANVGPPTFRMVVVHPAAT
jgi:hypothetical protein